MTITEPSKPATYRTFEDCIDLIDESLRKRRSKWTLNSIAWMDYDDVSQIIRVHIHKKWSQYDQDKPLEPWINKIITHQMKNLVRNNYSNYAKPCVKCAAAQADDGCSLYVKQCSACPLFKSWEKRKKNAYNIKIPVSIEYHTHELSEKFDDGADILGSMKRLESKLKEILKPVEWIVYEALYINDMSEADLAAKLGYTTSECNRTPGYKQIKNIQKSLFLKVKKHLYSEGSEIL